MIEFKVEGVTCGGCVNRIASAIKNADPKAKVIANIEAHLICVDTSKDKNEISKIIEKSGYKVVGSNPSA